MFNRRNLSQQSADTIIKLSVDLRKELLAQFKSFEPSRNEYLLNELINLLKFKNKKIKYQTSFIYLEININQMNEIIDLLSKLEAYHQSIDLKNLTSKLNKIKKKVIDKLIMLPTKVCQEFNEELTNEEKTKKIFSLVFKYLSIQDLLICRLVSKQFKHFSDHTNSINKLIIGQPYLITNNYDYWYYNIYKLKEDQDIISLKCFRTIQKLSIFNLDTNLKYLRIYDDKFKLEDILNLNSLESIEFYCWFNKHNRFNLNNLKVFATYNCSVELDTPKLEKIQFRNIDDIKLNSSSESIKHLITSNYDNRLDIFFNLEIMELRYIYLNSFVINKNLLYLFRKLKQLKINLIDHENYSDEELKYSLTNILNDKIKLKRSTDIYLQGIKIENIDKYNQLVSEYDDEIILEFTTNLTKYESKDPYWKFRLNNYDLLDLNLPFIRQLCYGQLEKCVNNIKNDLPYSFFDKFIYIDWVIVQDSVNDIDGLNWFLNKLKYLNELSIGRNVLLDEVFYNNLPNTIRELEIRNQEDINYDFILKLSNLVKFYTWCDKDLFNLVFESFLNLKYLNTFRFNYKNKLILIEYNGKYFYLNREDKELDYNQLIKVCNKIRSNGLNCNLM